MLIRDHEIQGLPEAVKRENDIRDAAFLDLTTDICGIQIRQMTPRDLLILDGVGNPISNFGVPKPKQLRFFLWLLSDNPANSSFSKFLFERRVDKLPFRDAVVKCWNYARDTFQDSPPDGDGHSVPYAGWCAHLIDAIASEYSAYDADKVLDTPFKQLFQFCKVIRKRKDDQYSPHNPSDKIRRQGALELFKQRTELLKLLKGRLN